MSTDQCSSHVVFDTTRYQHQHLVTLEQNGVAAGYDDVTVAKDRHDRGLAWADRAL